MFFRNFRSHALSASFTALLLAGGLAEAHVVPNMTVEADFDAGGGYKLRINVDPRTFLAADPTALPPVPASWYQEQTPEQSTATRQKAREYLGSVLGLLFDGKKAALPSSEIVAIDGADNTALKPETQEVHLLAIVKGDVPAGASEFQIDFAKEGATSMILLQTQAGKTEPRPQVLFPGEVSRPYPLAARKSVPADRTGVLQPAPLVSLTMVILTSITIMVMIVGWRLLIRYRHHHRLHRRPKPNDVNN